MRTNNGSKSHYLLGNVIYMVNIYSHIIYMADMHPFSIFFYLKLVVP
jgi:hypothetical protein